MYITRQNKFPVLMKLKIFYLKHTTSTYALTNFIHICIYNYQHVGIWSMVNWYRFKLEFVSTLQPLHTVTNMESAYLE